MSHTYFHEMMRGVLLLSHAMVERGDGKYYTTWNNKTKKTKKVVMKLPTGVLYWIKEPNYKSDLSAHFLEAIVGTKKMGEGKHSFYNTMRVHAQDSYKEESYKRATEFHISHHLNRYKTEGLFYYLFDYEAKTLRKDTKENYLNALEGITASILNSFMKLGFSGYFYLPKAKGIYTKSKYNQRITSRGINYIIEKLVELGYLEKQPPIYFLKGNKIASWQRKCARYRANLEFFKCLAYEGITLKNIRYGGEEIIIKKKPEGKLKEVPINYKDTPEIIKMRNQLKRYNDLLAKTYVYIYEPEIATIQVPEEERNKVFGKDWKTNPLLGKDKSTRYRIDTPELYQDVHGEYVHNYYYRVFNRGSTKFGGRFYGHWITKWLGHKHLRRNILINGSRCVELDYSGMNLCIAYSLLGMDEFKEMDMYSISGLDRDDVKQFTTIALNSTSLKKACKSTIKELGLKENKTNMDMFEHEIPLALSELHPMIYEKYFYRGKDTGAMFMRHESNIANEVIMKFVSKDIPILVLHDSFIVQEKHKDLLGRTMYAEFNKYWTGRSEYTGIRCKPCTPIVK
jgi:hypothetical protein